MSACACRGAAAGCLIGFLLPAAASQIGPGQELTREIQGGATDTYDVSFAAEQYARFTLDSKAVLSARLLRPSGDVAVAIENNRQHEQPVSLTLIARSSGVYRLRLEAPAGQPGGKYTLRLDVRKAVAIDTQAIQAETELREGRVLFAAATASARRAAIPRFQSAIALAREASDQLVEKNALRALGRVYNLLGESPLAVKAFGDVLDFARKYKDRPMQAEALNNLGLEHSYGGEYAQGISELREAIALWKELGDDLARVPPTNNLALGYIFLGELDSARENYEESFRILSEHSDLISLGVVRAGIASVFLLQGRYQAALTDYAKAREIWRQAGSRGNEATALGNMGVIYMHLGEPKLAVRYLDEALAIWRSVGDRAAEANGLRNLGALFHSLGESERGLGQLQESLQLFEAVGRPREQAAVLNRLGAVASEMGRRTEAVEYFSRGQSMARQLGDPLMEAIATLGLAREAVSRDPAEALKLAETALRLAEAGGYRPEQESVLVTMGRAEAALGRLDSAREHMLSALAIAESIRASLAGADFRRSYFAGVRNRYDLLIDILMRQGRPAEAFAVSERARARSLLEQLGESRSEVQQGVDPQLLEREKRIRAALRVKISAPEPQVEQLLEQYREVSNTIHAQNPRYAVLTQPEPLSLTEVQHNVLDSETVLLEYALGEDRSYVWAVTRDAVVTRELPPRAKIEAAARAAWLDLSTRQETGASRLLGRMLLDPVGAALGRKRLAIAAEGALQYIPFAALPSGDGAPLLTHHEIVHLPSASIVKVLRDQVRSRLVPLREIAVFGDPVFSRDDPRLLAPPSSRGAARVNPAASRSGNAANIVSSGEPAGELERSAAESGVAQFDRLLTTRAEAEAIAAFAGASRSRVFLDFDATREAASSPELQNYRIVHFATHGLLNNRHPELSGLVFSLFDREGRPRNGFLQAFEVYNLRLAADLVVLSACQTALGNDVRGEGLLGLSRGFMYAGAPRVLASLWKVPDAASAELMKHFYRALLVDKLRPAAALRAAQTAMRTHPRTASPYYWAGFVLQGEWN